MRPLLGLLARRLLLLWLTWCVYHGWLLPFWCLFIFTKVYSNTFDICLRWILIRCPVWTVSRDPILRISVDLFCTSLLLVLHRPNYSEVSLFSDRLVALPWALLVPMFPVLVGESTEFLEGLPCKKNQFPRKSCACLGLFSSRDEEGLLGWLPYSHNGLTQMSVFPLWGKRD